MITVAHAEVLIPICDLSLDITPEGGGFHYRITDLRSKCLVQTEGGLFVSFDNAKCKAAAAARNYAGGYQGPLVDFSRPSLGTAQVLGACPCGQRGAIRKKSP
jgi:hypothetical protein